MTTPHDRRARRTARIAVQVALAVLAAILAAPFMLVALVANAGARR